MFAFCVQALGLSEGETFRRILAARLGRTFPIVFEKVRLAPRSMGFREEQARRAVAEVERMHDQPPALEQALREALAAAMARAA